MTVYMKWCSLRLIGGRKKFVFGMRGDIRAYKHPRDWAALDKCIVMLARKIVYLFIY